MELRTKIYATAMATGALGGFIGGEVIGNSLIASAQREAAIIVECSQGQHELNLHADGVLYCAGVKINQVPGPVAEDSRIVPDWHATLTNSIDRQNGIDRRSKIAIPIFALLGTVAGRIIGTQVNDAAGYIRRKRASRKQSDSENMVQLPVEHSV